MSFTVYAIIVIVYMLDLTGLVCVHVYPRTSSVFLICFMAVMCFFSLNTVLYVNSNNTMTFTNNHHMNHKYMHFYLES